MNFLLFWRKGVEGFLHPSRSPAFWLLRNMGPLISINKKLHRWQQYTSIYH